MPKTVEQLAASKGGETAESNGFGAAERPLRPAGVYELKNNDGEVVDTIIAKVHPKFGDSQAAALERVGYRFVRKAEAGEIKEIEVDAKHLATENVRGTTDEDIKGLQARLALLEKQNAELEAAKRAEETKGASDNAVAANAKTEAQAEAEAQVAARTGVDSPLSNEETAPEGEPEGEGEDTGEEVEKPLSQQTRAELEATAEKEGIALTDQEDTNDKIREKIKSVLAERNGN